MEVGRQRALRAEPRSRAHSMDDGHVGSSWLLQCSRVGAMPAPSLSSSWRRAWTQQIHRRSATNEWAAWVPGGSNSDVCAGQPGQQHRAGARAVGAGGMWQIQSPGSTCPHTGMRPWARPSRISREARNLHCYTVVLLLLKCWQLIRKTKEDAYLLRSPQNKTRSKTKQKQHPNKILPGGSWFSVFSFLNADVSFKKTSHLFYRQEFLLKARHSELIHTIIWTSNLFVE